MPTINQILKFNRKKKKKLNYKIFNKAPFRKAIVEKAFIMTPRKPNSARRKVIIANLNYNQKKIRAAIPGQGHNLQKYSEVLIRGKGPRDLPGIKLRVVRGVYSFICKETILRKHGRSKFGVKLKDIS